MRWCCSQRSRRPKASLRRRSAAWSRACRAADCPLQAVSLIQSIGEAAFLSQLEHVHSLVDAQSPEWSVFKRPQHKCPLCFAQFVVAKCQAVNDRMASVEKVGANISLTGDTIQKLAVGRKHNLLEDFQQSRARYIGQMDLEASAIACFLEDVPLYTCFSRRRADSLSLRSRIWQSSGRLLSWSKLIGRRHGAIMGPCHDILPVWPAR